MGPRLPVVIASYLRWQQAAPWQQSEPLQHPALADFANEVPKVNINRAARLRIPVIIFFIWILLIKFLTTSQMALVTRHRLTRRQFAMVCS